MGSTPRILKSFLFRAQRQYKYDIHLMRQTCLDLIERRKKDQSEHEDLLDSLLKGVDPTTGARLSEETCVDNLITFLIAGHETTAGLLGFVFYYLAKYPHVQRKAQEEVDRVYGDGSITVNDLQKLRYITAILREALRLNPTAPSWGVSPHRDEIIGGKWHVKKGQPLNIMLHSVHRDREVYGPTADEFDPERMLDEAFERLPPNAWKPFGNGKRGCIGRAFAWQEALLITSYLLHKFYFTLHDPNYTLVLQEALTVKPKGCRILAQPRGKKPTASSATTNDSLRGASGRVSSPSVPRSSGPPLLVLYGSNAGTCEALGRQLARDIESRSSYTCTLAELDSYVGKLPRDQPVLILTGSYDGAPPSNAVKFVKWLERPIVESLKGVSYAVFGCGHKDWRATLYKVPAAIDELLAQKGAHSLAPLFKVDTGSDDAFVQLDMWIERDLTGALDMANTAPGGTDSLRVFLQDPPNHRAGYVETVVCDVKLLTTPTTAKKIQVDLMVPTGLAYSVGDSISILPLNPKHTIQRALSRFHLAWDTYLKLENDNSTHLPTEYPISVADLLGSFVELGQTATLGNMKTLIDATDDWTTKQALLSLRDAHEDHIADKHVSVLDLLEQFPTIPISIEGYLSMLPLLRPRIYSIASDPQWQPGLLSIIASVIDEPHWSGSGRQHLGVATNYLADLLPGGQIRVSMKQANPFMQLPPTASLTHPIIMIASGSGIAPFRGFIQKRALQARAGQSLSRAVLFFGCRRSDEDDLYRSELDGFEREGIVEVKRAYSREVHSSDTRGGRYVQDRLELEKEDVIELWKLGARVYVCGGDGMARGVRAVLTRILEETGEGGDELLVAPRYVTEIFS